MSYLVLQRRTGHVRWVEEPMTGKSYGGKNRGEGLWCETTNGGEVTWTQKTIKGWGSPSPSTFLHHPLRSTWYKTLSMWSGALLSVLVRFQDDRREEKRGFRRSDQFFKCQWRRDLEWDGERGKNAAGENGGRGWKGKKRPLMELMEMKMKQREQRKR